jgi:hypothetical protein
MVHNCTDIMRAHIEGASLYPILGGVQRIAGR